ncbi:lipopolysaccharide transport periplasmic protein LptA [Acuticoccus sp. M5D2P5]|uniref:LptA/OstA family protein n=1 Tax=Acuticoccus kalidii TaxID=2910977 RepID=UPI001F256535|nr:LptA/OstA family protein [Acuticoccus kalidii]MCF3932299.1 lipopolysaccharide transport periplasmic protein LptA [Acuticoccus kalidii]
MLLPIIRAGLAALLLGAAAGTAAAQTLQTGFADFGSDQSTPIEIEADELEVQDRNNVAVFTGNVTVKQNDAALQTARLVVHYAQAALTAEAARGSNAPATNQNQRISKLEATGNVLLTTNGQAATGDTGIVNFDSRTLALNGNVTLTQDNNVITGDTITVDLNTGIARVESKSRVRVLLTPGGQQPAEN